MTMNEKEKISRRARKQSNSTVEWAKQKIHHQTIAELSRLVIELQVYRLQFPAEIVIDEFLCA